jgi:hypothetical protein
MTEAAVLHSTLSTAGLSATCCVSTAPSLLDAAAQLAAAVDPASKANYDNLIWEAALLVEAFDTVNEQ